MSEKKLINDLTTGSVQKQMMKFAMPFVLANLLQTFYNLVDMMVVGQFVGKVGLSAVSVGGDLLNLFVFISIGFCSAGQVIISQYVGKKEYGNVSKTIGTFAVFMAALAVVCTTVGLVFKTQFLHLMNAPEEAFGQAYEYVTVCYAGLAFVFGYNMVSSILRGMGNSRTPLIFVGIATVVNLILDYIFVAIFDSGAMGAAVATVFGQGVAFVCAIVYLYRHRESFGFDFSAKSFIPDKKILKILLRLGVPMSLQTCAINLSSLVVNSFINAYGVVACAVTGVGNKIGNIASIVTNGLNTAGSSMVGQNYAAGKKDRVVKIMGVVGIYSLVFAAILSVIMIVTPEGVFSLFDKSPDTLAMARSYVVIAVISFFGFASRAPFLSLINGQGHAVLGCVIGILDSIVARIGLSILLGKTFGMDLMGFWLGNVLAGYIFTIAGGIYFFFRQMEKETAGSQISYIERKKKMGKLYNDYSVFKKLNLEDEPIGVKFSFFRPEDVEPLEQEAAMSLCEMLRMSQRENRAFYFSKDNQETCVGKILLGMEDMAPFAESGNIGQRLGVFNDARCNQHFYQFVPKLDRNVTNYVSFSPVSKLTYEPDVLVVSASPEKAELVMRAMTYSTGEMYKSTCTPVMGCAWLLLHPYRTQEVNFIVPALVHGPHGRELYPSDTLLIGIPYRWIPAIIKGLSEMEFHLEGHESREKYYAEFEGILKDLSEKAQNP